MDEVMKLNCDEEVLIIISTSLLVNHNSLTDPTIFHGCDKSDNSMDKRLCQILNELNMYTMRQYFKS